jgi:hypothetical protein
MRTPHKKLATDSTDVTDYNPEIFKFRAVFCDIL